MWIRSRRKDLIMKSEGRVVPDSCCLTFSTNCAIRDHPSNIAYGGCIYKILEEIQFWLKIIGGTSIGLGVIHIFGMILAISLYIKLMKL